MRLPCIFGSTLIDILAVTIYIGKRKTAPCAFAHDAVVFSYCCIYRTLTLMMPSPAIAEASISPEVSASV